MVEFISGRSMAGPKHAVRSLLGTTGTFSTQARNWVAALRWRMFGTRPRLNAESAAAHIQKRLLADAPTGEMGKSIHVRIAFHYVPHRLMYLVEAITAAAELPFKSIDLWVDTNTPEVIPLLERLPQPVNVKVWEDLDHPFLLTWVHRRAMRERLDDFEAFLYLEDDMIIPRRSMQMWLRETPMLARLGLIPGFVRVEEGPGGRLYLSDYIESVSHACIREVNGRPYLNTPYPYQACWVYDRTQMRELASTPNYLSGAVEEKDLPLFERDGPPDVRAQVALGLSFTDIPEGYETRAMVPLTDDLEVSPDALIFHSPSNYTNMRPPHPAGLGQLPLSKVLAPTSSSRRRVV